jgi:two-component system cell cycle sensor histidine kinase/response regulator CckA
MAFDDGPTIGQVRTRRSTSAVTRAGRPVRVLVVDDEASIRYFVERALNGQGFAVTTANGADEALDLAGRLEPFDLLLTDVVMPPINGDELARRLRRLTPDIKVLYLTGYSDTIFSERTMLWKDEAFLEKPCSLAALLEAVSLLLSGHTNT